MKYRFVVKEQEVVIGADTARDSGLFHQIAEMYRGRKVTLTFKVLYMDGDPSVPALQINLAEDIP